MRADGQRHSFQELRLRVILDNSPGLPKGTVEISVMSGYVDPALLDGSSAYNSWQNPTAHVPPVSDHEPTVPQDVDEDTGDLFGDVPAALARSATYVPCAEEHSAIANLACIGRNRGGQTGNWMMMV
jgi:hypothetical protein